MGQEIRARTGCYCAERAFLRNSRDGDEMVWQPGAHIVCRIETSTGFSRCGRKRHAAPSRKTYQRAAIIS